MSCDRRRNQGWERITQVVTRLSAATLEDIFLQAKAQAVAQAREGHRLSSAQREEVASQTRALLGYLRCLGVTELPVHGKSGLPRISSQVGFAAVWQELVRAVPRGIGAESRAMSGPELVEALRLLDRELETPLQGILAGGAAMILSFGSKRNTADVDAFLSRAVRGAVRQAVRRVAAERGIKEDWLNDAVKGYSDVLPPDFRERLQPLEFGFRRLRLQAVGRPEEVALKLVGLREQDIEDLHRLLPTVTAAEQALIWANIRRINRIRPDWAMKMSYFLREYGWTSEL